MPVYDKYQQHAVIAWIPYCMCLLSVMLAMSTRLAPQMLFLKI